MKSAITKRSVVLDGHKTSVSLEEPFWSSLREIAAQRAVTVSALLREIDLNRRQGNLSSAIRVFVLENVRTQPPSPLHGNGQRYENHDGQQRLGRI